jgi:Ca-activated chloride channel family protein
MTLKYPWVLLFLPIIIALIYWGIRGGGYQKVIAFPLANRNFKIPPRLLFPTLIPFLVRCLAISFAIFALARPQTSSSQVRRLTEGIDVMIALDVSQSMTIEDVDVRDRNRLDVAKETVKKFIGGRQDDRIGFLMFSGEAITLCPPTLDYQILLDSVDRSDVGLLRDGTAIGEALATASNRLKDSNAKSRVVVLITDGDNNMGSIEPLDAGEIAAGYGIKVYSIALGKQGVVQYPEYQNFFGVRKKVYRQTNSTINPDLLMKISQETGGKFFRADDEDSMERVFEEINKLEKNRVETKDRILWEEHYQLFLLASFLTFLLDLLLRVTIFRILPG